MSEITFSRKQEEAIATLGEWLRAPFSKADQVRTLAGYAGSGKTTILRTLAESSQGSVQFAAYTGKAAYVMRSKGCANATTIHSLIYRPAGESKSDALRDAEIQLTRAKVLEPRDQHAIEAAERRRDAVLMGEKRKPMFSLNVDSDLRFIRALFLDECSMVDEVIAADLESFNIKILACGDPAQLPPVGGGGHYTNRRPDVFLDEVHRQARESGILRMATDVRERGTYDRTPGAYGRDCVVVRPGDISKEEMAKLVTEADQTLVGLNATRHGWNARLRQLGGKSEPWPQAGDKVVCLRNNHEAGLLNGGLWRVHESVHDLDCMTSDMVISSEEDGGTGIPVTSWLHHFMGREAELKKLSWSRRDKEEFDYGYALTVHKAQGSQWDDVVITDEAGAFRNDAKKWLYTGITRAAKMLTVIA